MPTRRASPQPRWDGNPFRIEPPLPPGATARTAPRDSRAYGRRGSFHLIAACGLTAPVFRFGDQRSGLTHEIIFLTATPPRRVLHRYTGCSVSPLCQGMGGPLHCYGAVF